MLIRYHDFIDCKAKLWPVRPKTYLLDEGTHNKKYGRDIILLLNTPALVVSKMVNRVTL